MIEKENYVDIADIEKELQMLSEQDKEQNKVRACLFNLIIYTQEEKRKDYLQAFISSVIRKYPCRIIFIQNKNNSDANYLKAFVSTESYDGGETIITCDQITLQVSGTYLNRVPYVVSPLIVTDLPIYLFWDHDPTNENQVLPYLQNFATKIIFDTDNISDLQSFSKNILNIMTNLNIEVADIQWVLSSVWRNVFSEVFDSGNRIEQLRNAKKITIEINRAKNLLNHHCEIQSHYLHAWLASRMGWSFQSISHIHAHTQVVYQTPDGIVEFYLISGKSQELPCGSIISIEIEGKKHLNISIIRQVEEKNAVLHICEENTCFMPYRVSLPDLSKGFNFIKQIFFETTSTHYKDMLKKLLKIDWEKI